MYLIIDAIIDPSSWLHLLFRQPTITIDAPFADGHFDHDAVLS